MASTSGLAELLIDFRILYTSYQKCIEGLSLFYTELMSVVFITVMFALIHRTKKKKLPPMIEEGMIACIVGLTGAHSPQWVMNQSRKMGHTIFRLNMPEYNHFVIVADPKVARLIIEGDNAKGFPAAEKTHHYKKIDRNNGGYRQMASRRTEGDGWAETRKVIAPSFSANNLHKRLPEIYSKSDEFSMILNDHAASGIPLKDISHWMSKLTLDIIGVSMFGVDFKILSGETSEDVETFMRETPNATKEYFLRQLINPLRSYMFWDSNVASAEASVPKFLSFAQGIIDNYRKAPKTENDKSSILGHIVRCMAYETENERAADALGFLLAGEETSAFQLSWAVVEITKDPRVLAKLQDELDSALPCRTDKFTPDVLSRMTYLHYVIDEVMRLQPVVAGGMVRQVPKDIEHEGFTIPRGATANIHYMRQGIHDPDDFIPERWEPTDIDASILKEICIPFSSGKRNCIGQNLAMLELRLIIATIFRSFTFEFTAEVEFEYFQTYKPKNVDLIVKCRSK